MEPLKEADREYTIGRLIDRLSALTKAAMDLAKLRTQAKQELAERAYRQEKELLESRLDIRLREMKRVAEVQISGIQAQLEIDETAARTEYASGQEALTNLRSTRRSALVKEHKTLMDQLAQNQANYIEKLQAMDLPTLQQALVDFTIEVGKWLLPKET